MRITYHRIAEVAQLSDGKSLSDIDARAMSGRRD